MKKRILVVDDEPGFTQILRLSLEQQGSYEVREVNESRKTLAAARDFRPDLILLDMMMPMASGSEIAAQLKADRDLSSIPIIFLTALVSDEAECAGSFGMGRLQYLPKSIKVRRLVECIEQATDAKPATRMK